MNLNNEFKNKLNSPTPILAPDTDDLLLINAILQDDAHWPRIPFNKVHAVKKYFVVPKEQKSRLKLVKQALKALTLSTPTQGSKSFHEIMKELT